MNPEGAWFLAVRTGGDRSSAIRLTRSEQGLQPGTLVDLRDETVLAVEEPYKTSVRLSSLVPSHKGHQGPFECTIMLASPPGIYCADGHGRQFYSLEGTEVNEKTLHSHRHRYAYWSVYLIDGFGRDACADPLLTVDATAEG